jgi:acetoacetyl-CoA synthetase
VPTSPLWRPSADRIARSALSRFMALVESHTGRSSREYADLHAWSVRHLDAFWRDAWDFFGVIGDRREPAAIDLDTISKARFFPNATLNFTENLLRRDDSAIAVYSRTESGRRVDLTFAELRAEVARTAAALRRAGVGPGDRVAGLVANIPEAVIAALGTAAVGGVWSSCSPDFGADGVLDRFGQIQPRVLVAVDGYSYGGKRFDCASRIEDVARRLPGLERTVLVHLDGNGRLPDAPGAIDWRRWLDAEDEAPGEFDRFAYDHPLFILFSSGTTGVPKCIVHRAGGVLLEHFKEHQLQGDIQHDDRVFYFTTCGWMMWNWLVSALASGASIVLYDGAPLFPDAHRLFDLADEVGVTFFGVSPKYLDTLARAGIEPRQTHSLHTVRTIASTGSPLSVESFEFVYRAIAPDVLLTSVSGGTDIVGCFVGGNPNGAVWAGEIQAAGLGMDIRAYSPDGRALHGEPGELVCATPFPSMPIGFWNDPEGRRYRETYFERFPGVWCHGDWIQTTPHGGFVIHGRSDATLNPQGVRIGTAEIYRQVELIPEVVDSLAIGQKWEGDERIVLFVKLAPGQVLDDALRRRIAQRIRTHASPRHVPARIVQVGDVPRTRSGKLAELAVRRIVHGEPVDNREALANPESLELYCDLPELRT